MYNTTSGPVVIIVAMNSELIHLHRLAAGWEEIGEGVWPTQRTTWRGLPLIAVRCGIGMVTAAAATERAITRFGPRWIMNFGCAGAHTRGILPGDVVIGTGVVPQGRLRISASEGIVPMNFPFTVAGELERRTSLQSDPGLVALAQEAAQEIALEAWPEPHRLPLHPEDGAVRVHTGIVASADMWLQDPAWLDAVHARTGSLCEDMEAAAIAQIATLHGIPFLTIKDISNNEYHAASLFEGASTVLPEGEVGKRAAALTIATIDRMFEACRA